MLTKIYLTSNSVGRSSFGSFFFIQSNVQIKRQGVPNSGQFYRTLFLCSILTERNTTVNETCMQTNGLYLFGTVTKTRVKSIPQKEMNAFVWMAAVTNRGGQRWAEWRANDVARTRDTRPRNTNDDTLPHVKACRSRRGVLAGRRLTERSKKDYQQSVIKHRNVHSLHFGI